MKKISKQSVKQLVLNELRKEIFQGRLTPGEEITQIGIADMLGVSRMPVREAFQQLAEEGLITIQSNRRVVVSQITKEDIVDHYEIRALLEGLAAKKASKNTDYHNKIKNIYENSLACDESEYIELNKLFHNTIWEASKSERLIKLLTKLWNSMQSQLPILHPNRMDKSNDEHAKIVEAILNQNEKAAFLQMQMHIEQSKDDFIHNFQFKI